MYCKVFITSDQFTSLHFCWQMFVWPSGPDKEVISPVTRLHLEQVGQEVKAESNISFSLGQANCLDWNFYNCIWFQKQTLQLRLSCLGWDSVKRGHQRQVSSPAVPCTYEHLTTEYLATKHLNLLKFLFSHCIFWEQKFTDNLLVFQT